MNRREAFVEAAKVGHRIVRSVMADGGTPAVEAICILAEGDVKAWNLTAWKAKLKELDAITLTVDEWVKTLPVSKEASL